MRRRSIGPYQLQAAIAQTHNAAATWARHRLAPDRRPLRGARRHRPESRRRPQSSGGDRLRRRIRRRSGGARRDRRPNACRSVTCSTPRAPRCWPSSGAATRPPASSGRALDLVSRRVGAAPSRTPPGGDHSLVWRPVTRPFFIDTDTGSDDAVALVIALTHPGIDVVGIGVVAGNVPLELRGPERALHPRAVPSATTSRSTPARRRRSCCR